MTGALTSADGARRSTGVAIIGAGITGLSLAYHLAMRGAEGVVVYERTGIAAEASGVQPGGVRQQWGTEINCRMARESFDFYKEVKERLGARIDPALQSCGYLFVAHSTSMLEQLKANVTLQNRLGIRSRVLTPEEAVEILPGLETAELAGAAYCAEDGYFDKPQAVVQAFADAAVREGVTIEHREVVELLPGGGPWTVRFSDGTSVAAGQVVVAAGYDSPALLGTTGVEVPIEKEPRYLFFSEPIRERLLEPLVISAERRFAAKQLADGRLLASDLSASGDPANGREVWRKRIRANVVELLPLLEFVALPSLVEGFYDMTPDGQAVIGQVPGHHGLWAAAGFSGHGFMMAPAVGDWLATAVLGGVMRAELDVLSLGRFETRRLVPEPQVV